MSNKVKLIIDKNKPLHIKIITENRRYVNKIKEEFTQYVDGFQYIPSYRAGSWDGKVCMMSGLSFPYGLLFDYIRIHKNFFKSIDLIISSDLKKMFNNKLISKINYDLSLYPRPYQKECIETCIKHTKGIIRSATACHAKGDKIILYNGNIEKIENIKIGDYVIGKDGKSKKVINTFNGVDDLYEINPKNNRKPITVTKNHLLHLTFTNRGGKYNKKWNTFENISVENYLKKSNYYKHISKLYYNKEIINFKEEKINCKLSPYFIGIYLGDGSKNVCSICNKDKEVIEKIYEESNKFNMKVVTKPYSKYDYFIKGSEHKRNKIFKEFENIGIIFGTKNMCPCENRFIPKIIFNQNIKYRKEVLAGLIDSDGCLSNNRTYYEYVSKSKKLANDVKKLSISLGLVCSSSIKIINNVNYYKTNIMGNISKIPVKIPRKQNIKKSNTDAYKSGFNIKYIGEKEYYGIQVEDSLYLTEEGMVTHNSGKSLVISYITKILLEDKKIPVDRVLIITPSTGLVEQFYTDMIEYGLNDSDIGRIYSKSKKADRWDTPITISTWQSLMKKHDKLLNYECIIFDECLDGNTLIKTINGEKKIKNIQKGEKIISYNIETSTFKEDIVDDIYINLEKSSNEKMYELFFDNNTSIKVTGNHKILTENGYIRADELSENDEIITI